MKPNQIIPGNILEIAPTLPAQSVNCIVTSPPYWGLRDYGHADQIGLEATPEAYVQTMVSIFRALWPVLRDDGTLWLNLGDSYASDSKWGGATGGKHANGLHGDTGIGRNKTAAGLPDKNLVGIPWRVALALQADGWYLRSDIIWCLSGGIEVYARTQKGEGPTTIKDLVRLDPATVQLWNGEKWTQVLGWSETPRPEKPIEIELRSGEKLGCTPGHLWPTQRGLLRADELRQGDIIQACELPEPPQIQTPQHIPDDIGWLVGLYLAEGSKGKDGRLLQIAGHIKEQDRLRRLKGIAEAYGGTCRMHATIGASATINLYGSVLVGIIDQYVNGKTSHDKCLSSACWQRSNSFLREVLNGYLSGDGHYDSKNDRWRLGFTRNHKLASNLRTICARLGISIRLKLSTATNQDKTFKSFRGEIRCTRSDHHNSKQDGEIVRIGRSNGRKFWDIGVGDDPQVFALASGILTHNSKPNPMPESVTDRPTKAHEYIFLLAKSERYYYDAEVVREDILTRVRTREKFNGESAVDTKSRGWGSHCGTYEIGRNRRTVWTIATKPYSGAHFAVFPPALIEPCILAGCPPGGVVLDPFFGSGTVGQVAIETGRQWLGVELNPDYIKLAEQRIAAAQPALIAPSGAVLPNKQNQAELLQPGLWE